MHMQTQAVNKVFVTHLSSSSLKKNRSSSTPKASLAPAATFPFPATPPSLPLPPPPLPPLPPGKLPPPPPLPPSFSSLSPLSASAREAGRGGAVFACWSVAASFCVINAAGMLLSSGSGPGESSGDQGSCGAADSLDCAMRVLKALTAPVPSWGCPCAANNHLLSTVKGSAVDGPSQAMVTAMNINKHNTFSIMP